MQIAVRAFEKLFAQRLLLLVLPILLICQTAFTQDFKTLEKQLKTETNDSLRVLKTIQLSRKLHEHKHHETREYDLAQHALDLALTLNDTLLYARALDNMGLLYRYHQWYGQSLPLHIKAYDLIKARDVDPLYKMICANNAGLAARYDQQYALAVTYYQKALRLATLHQDLKNIAISSNGLGNTLSQMPERDAEALEYFQNALNAERTLNDSLGMAMNLLSISDYYLQQQDFVQGLRHLGMLWEINRKRNDRFGMAITNEYFGHAYFKQKKDLMKARDFYQKALQQYRELNNQLKIADVLHSLGKVQSDFSNPGDALGYFRASFHLADSLQNKSLMMDNAYGMSRIKESQGRFSEALAYYQLGKRYQDSINISRQQVRIEALTKQFNLEKKESEIALLHKEQALTQKTLAAQQAKLKTHRIYLLLLFGGIALTVLFITIQFHNRKAKRKAEIRLREKEKDLLQAEYEKNLAQAEMLIARMQVNPHFIFNCLNAINLLIQKEETRKASQYLVVFSRFIRMILEMPRSQTIPLSEELELIRYYLTLEEKRFDGDFNFSVNTCAGCNVHEVHIPPLLLQPFVENAIWHGLLPSCKTTKRLQIDIVRDAGNIRITIDDNGVGRKPGNGVAGSESKTSMGMKITRNRIRQFNRTYPCRIDLDVVDKGPGAGTRIVLYIINLPALAET